MGGQDSKLESHRGGEAQPKQHRGVTLPEAATTLTPAGAERAELGEKVARRIEHLDAMVVLISNDDPVRAVYRYADWTIKLAIAKA